ncbi:hypothetical protein P152DRAFT_513865 [Eremomyces bilateralis CBS 781.70]|uniref:F-box domain-containing protein n=1 Tax=Eremomyces bilateralis CBS 781.70 TaxID=1392243 RepID=A0A6G1G446_9PEZI|nr:uncharacterized protein P152DRAFT_513865 [Eremomyces bilateralis CBS 781.70]KAF1812833.1 hypothetical protein P152DRAFT_513865 [Eremomyces bilateralis CBS 781.70]
MLEYQSRSHDSISLDDTIASKQSPRVWQRTQKNVLKRICSYAPSIASTSSIISTSSSDSSRPSSGASSATTISWSARFDTVPKLVQTPWELERPKRWSVRPAGSYPTLPERVFRNMPDRVYTCITEQLEKIHTAPGSESCAGCYQKDLLSLSRTSRRWARIAQYQLYRTLRIFVDPEDHGYRKSKSNTLSGIKLLRRTLQERPDLAKRVLEIRGEHIQNLMLRSGTKEQERLMNELALIVMACPYLEKLRGLHLTHTGGVDHITSSLSTRRRLKEKVWIMNIEDHSDLDDEDPQPTPTDTVDRLSPSTDIFMNHHINWTSLTTLFLIGNPTTTMTYRSIVGTFRSLPSLQHLLLAHLPAPSFTDRTLQALPPLRSLRLQSLPGITDKGLLRLISSPSLLPLRRLSLIDLNIASLSLISHILRTLTLTYFTLIQDRSPSLPHGTTLLTPLFSSSSLFSLHWDILTPSPALHALASAIASPTTFPSLRSLCAPCDYQGTLQAACKPRADIPDASSPCNDRSSIFIEDADMHCVRDPIAARKAAQSRIEQARKRPGFRVVVLDTERGVVEKVYTFRDYMGTVGSRVEYVLDGEGAGGDDGGVVGLEELVGGGREVLMGMCTGGWNLRGGGHGVGRRGGDRGRELREFF